MGPPIKLIGERITTGTGLSAPILSFVNKTTGYWSANSFTMAECAAKNTSVDALSTSLYLHNSVAFFIATECHTPKSSVVDGEILQFSTAIIWLATCAPREVHYLLIQRIFEVHCNMTVP